MESALEEGGRAGEGDSDGRGIFWLEQAGEWVIEKRERERERRHPPHLWGFQAVARETHILGWTFMAQAVCGWERVGTTWPSETAAREPPLWGWGLGLLE